MASGTDQPRPQVRTKGLPHTVNDETPKPDDRPDEPDTGRRAVWSRRIAVVVLVAFAAFVIFNASVVLVLLLRSAGGGAGGPFGN
jgi:hypothetical protein